MTNAKLPEPTSLKASLAQALAAGEPMVLMVSMHGCPFCKVAREHYLLPMLREGKPRPHIVQINYRDAAKLLDFDGKPSTQGQVVAELKVSAMPTVLFFGTVKTAGTDRKTVEVAERLVGSSIPDFYGAYLEQRMATARQAIKPI